jgi:hypothetical protein
MEKAIELPLTEDERRALQRSAQSVRASLAGSP